MLPSCTSPQVPRVLTLVNTRLRSPTPVASCCISPSPRCTCSSRSDTSLNEESSRLERVLCSFSSTVSRIFSSLAALSSCSARSCCSRVARISAMRCSLRWVSSRSCAETCSMKRCCCSAWNRVKSCMRPSSWRAKLSTCSRSCCMRWPCTCSKRCCCSASPVRDLCASSVSAARRMSRRWSVRSVNSPRLRAKPSRRRSCWRPRDSSCSRSSARPSRCSSRSARSSLASGRRSSRATSSTMATNTSPSRAHTAICMSIGAV